MNNFAKICTVMLVGFVTSSCVPAALLIGAGATVGVASMQEGGLTTAASDTTIKMKIINNWVNNDFDIYQKLNVTVKEGRVLITGSVPNPDMRVEAVRLTWKVSGVKQVLNEIMVDNENDFGTMVSDSVITGSLKTRVMFDKQINSINYNIETNNGNIYLMGIARSQDELDRVIDYARNTKDVKNVINYVRVSGQAKVEDMQGKQQQSNEPMSLIPAGRATGNSSVESVESMPLRD